MRTVIALPRKKAREALRLLEQAWAYYEPVAQPVKADEPDQADLFPYYRAI